MGGVEPCELKMEGWGHVAGAESWRDRMPPTTEPSPETEREQWETYPYLSLLLFSHLFLVTPDG